MSCLFSIEGMEFEHSADYACTYPPEGGTRRQIYSNIEGRGLRRAEFTDYFVQQGFHREWGKISTLSCPNCSACTYVRIEVAGFLPSRTMRRVIKINDDFVFSFLAYPTVNQNHYNLFKSYMHTLHPVSNIATVNSEEFFVMMTSEPNIARIMEMRRISDKTLMGFMAYDDLPNGLSARYSIYDTSEPRRSLGTMMLLALLEYASKTGKPHVYLGAWVKGGNKMDYKARFRPLEGYDRTQKRWLPLEPSI